MARDKTTNYTDLIYIGVGTNLGDRLHNIQSAIEELKAMNIVVIRTASIYETEPWGFETSDTFLNTVFECSSSMNAMDCLKALQFVEKKMGRKKKLKIGYESRVIDLDILLFKNQQINLIELTIPHPYLTDRQFVIIPMDELVNDTFFTSLSTNFTELKNRFKDLKTPFVVHYPPLVNE
ncbi:2-amino-4-hydroxy-6-hydroxymethyldihydropteridine diphosphokinase [Fluviicola taffensis]|uniref:2-amino-4-hydroxy-6-hydroxymethyldihydropteridine pyrophosphokinase n=1 Tax=Fluviicola taffensis (strain DSM 16823 / NCIMB 13979 / RW262) TaxID=755732 RepID=F2IDV4_FLUTR|nr:2-amino-4-hydroxy-6-hydroxymethyldihydropteridine diphosphokinase [Fluviicola taffensis]AEA44496.1 2-amino-4-hydroxy-6-hydroxymethyldihydropteridine pyrophosphokinase [Fluviicola taffensis DSM 16823]